MDLADITGYSLRRKLGSGSVGTVWQVRDRASGRNAVLKHVPFDAFPDPRRLREDLSMLTRLRHPHLARLLEFRETDTAWILVSQHLVAGSLAALLERRGPLSTGELVTLLTPLAAAVHHLQSSGLTHGSITPNNVLFDADGRPVLTDATLRNGHPTTDLEALAALARAAGADPKLFTPTLFTKTPPQTLEHRLLSLAAPVPIAVSLPTDLSTSPPPTSADGSPDDEDPIAFSRGPLAAPPPKPPTAPTSPTQPSRSQPPATTGRSGAKRTRPWRRAQTRRGRVLRRLPHPAYGVLAAAAVAAAIVLAIGIATLRTLDTSASAQAEPTNLKPTPTNPRPTTPTRSPQPTKSTANPVDPAAWTRTLQALDAQRAQAFWTLDLDALDQIYVPGSQPWRADRALLTTYRRQQIRVQGLQMKIESATVTRRTPTTITLKTTDHLTAGEAIDHTGAKTPLPPGAPMTRLITLTTTPTSQVWRISTITRA